MRLQRSLGNQIVQRLVNSGNIMANLVIGRQNDPSEREADQVAEGAFDHFRAAAILEVIDAWLDWLAVDGLGHAVDGDQRRGLQFLRRGRWVLGVDHSEERSLEVGRAQELVADPAQQQELPLLRKLDGDRVLQRLPGVRVRRKLDASDRGQMVTLAAFASMNRYTT